MRRVFTCGVLLVMAGCAPPYVWGGAEGVERRLVEMVPLGSPPGRLEDAAERRGWDIDQRNIRSWPAGSKTYMHDTHLDCRSRGGPVVPIIVAHYSAPLETYVETLWLFDLQKRLADICVRKTVDTL